MGKTRPEPWYFAERAESLLLLHLTRRNDLELLIRPRGDEDSGLLDYLVYLKSGKHRTGRMFGIELKPSKNLKAKKIDESRNDSSLFAIRVPETLKEVPFPLCLVIFEIVDDRGFYRWFREPAIDAEGRASLVCREENWFARLDCDSLDQIINQVNQWHEHRPSQP